MSDQQQDTVITANDGPAADAVAAAVLAAQNRIIDAAVRRARRDGWCTTFESVMSDLFPEGPPAGGTEFVDSDGWSCRGYDRDGYDASGRDDHGRDRDGWSRDGWDRDGYGRDGYNRRGWNRDGLNRDGRDRNSPEVQAVYRYDGWGYDREGFNASGTDRNGYDRATVEAQGGVYRFDENRQDIDGRSRYDY